MPLGVCVRVRVRVRARACAGAHVRVCVWLGEYTCIDICMHIRISVYQHT